MNDHVANPIDPGSFFATIARWTGKHREVADLSARPARKEDEIILPEIDGVDVADGLHRIAGNKRLYRDLLAQFAAKQDSAASGIKEALETGDHGRAERLAHSLKGAAGNLGIGQIFKSAGKLEKAIRESHAGIQDLITELASVIDRQIQIIRAALLLINPDTRQPFDSCPADPAKTLKVMAQLKQLLEASDADASETYAKLTGLLNSAVDKSQWEALGAAVQSFDFDAALQKLNEVTREYVAKEKLTE